MSDRTRNLVVAAVLLVVLIAAAVLLGDPVWTLGFAVVLGLAGVALLRGNRWKTASLLVGSLVSGLAIVDIVALMFAPQAMGSGLVKVVVPWDWLGSHPVLGYAPQANLGVKARATFDGKPVYDVVYTITAERERKPPAAPDGASVYLFMGDSFVFGEGLSDSETLAAQFARLRGNKVRTVNLAASGYSANHVVRAFEAGLLDRFRGEPGKAPEQGQVKAVVTWIIPDHLRRMTGDASWLGSSPRYVLEGGVPRHTGSFNEHRWLDPIDGLAYLAREHFASAKAIGAAQRQELQAELLVALVLRLQALAREKFGAPLFVIYSWPDAGADSVIERLRRGGVHLINNAGVTWPYAASQVQIEHDGHPNAFQMQLIADELDRRIGD